VSALLVLPIVIPALTAAICLGFWRRMAWQRQLNLVGAVSLFLASIGLFFAVATRGTLTVQMGSWPAPFGITFVADPLGALMVALTGLVGLAGAVYSVGDTPSRHQRFGHFPLLHILLMGVCGAFLTGDIFNLYVWFEVMLIASFVLLGLGGTRPQMEGALKYVTLNLISSAIFLAAVGVLYGSAHTLNFADLYDRVPIAREQNPAMMDAVAALLLISFGVKAGVFPLYFWLPASYHTPPAAVSAVFAGLLTKVGVYALFRVFTIVFTGQPFIYQLVLAVAAVTMISGVLGAVSHVNIRRILSFHIISQIGYMVMGLGLLVSDDPAVRRLGLAAGIFYIAHHIIVKTNLFLIGGLIRLMRGSYELERIGGLARSAPWLGLLFLIPALSLAGIPPLSGFWAKLGVIRAGLEAQAYIVVAAALFTGLLTLISMMKIWTEAFWKAQPPQCRPHRLRSGRMAMLVGPIVGLATLTVLIGLVPQPLMSLSQSAADYLLDPRGYVLDVDPRIEPPSQEPEP
jgi:multicomponent Na+:H+ antiporter subunit D